ncbi:MAG: hypothetical protein EP330_23105 [Deltaproteobacteria bacterium]|nr:MAG: hypothetical protein EP330_23105 [Deltaproteobacteria bacterium]
MDATRHGLPPGPLSCATCTWHRGEGAALACQFLAPPAGEAVRIGDGPGCAHHEPLPDCLDCGACCREAFDSVPVDPQAQARLPAEMVKVHSDGWVDMVRVPSPLGCGTRCAALRGGPPYTCVVYAQRADTCRDLEAGSEACLEARRRVGLTAWGPGWTPDGPLFRQD